MREALRAASDDALGVTEARAQAARSTPGLLRRVAWSLAAVLLLLAGWFSWQVHVARRSIRLRDGAGWTFQVAGAPSQSYDLLVAGTTTFAGGSAYEVVCQRSDGSTPVPVGSGFVALHLLSLELVGVTGSMGRQELRARLLPFPYGPGSSWRCVVGRSWMESQWSASFQAAAGREPLTVPAGSFNALRVDYQVGVRGAAPVIRGSYWLADGVGPVQFAIEPAQSTFGIVPLTLELRSYH